ncbi:MAG: hypothetical protein WD355_01070 [Balneolaceae bacterium]
MSQQEGILHTIQEIEGQPDLWLDTCRTIQSNGQISGFLNRVIREGRLNIVLTGAGTSAYIGEVTEHLFHSARPGVTARAIPTTTLVTHFREYVDVTEPLLLVSFARSGNSPESVAAVETAEAFCSQLSHIAVTCNESGELAELVNNLPNGLAVVLPPASEDQGLAMTGSFTSMTLAAILLSRMIADAGMGADDMEKISGSARSLIEAATPLMKSLADKSFNRIVFLGSGPRLGIARESHLKVQELTDGEVIGKFDSFLGFRHGPKAVVNRETVVVFLFSADPNVFRYEKDLADEILREGSALETVGLFPRPALAEEVKPGVTLVAGGGISEGYDGADESFGLLSSVIPAQLLGFYKSLKLGLNPDSPSRNNAISRVVKGVTIYPV